MKFEGIESHAGSVLDIPSGATLPTKVQEGNLFLQTGATPILFFGLTSGWSKVIANLDVIAEGTTNKFFTTARVLATPVAGVSTTSTTTQLVATDTLLAAVGKLQGQLVAQLSTITSQATSISTNSTNITAHVGSGGASHAVATSSTAGFMSAADKAKVDTQISTNKYLTADVSNAQTTANTLVTISDLSFAVVAGSTYTFRFVVPYTAAATTTGSRWTLSGPTATMLAYSSRYPLTATTETVNYASAYGIPSASNASSLTAGNLAIIEGVVTPSAAGTIALQFASEIASSAIVAKVGASLTYMTH